MVGNDVTEPAPNSAGTGTHLPSADSPDRRSSRQAAPAYAPDCRRASRVSCRRVLGRAIGAPGKTPAVATALYPGSFDPLHLGHLSVIEMAATMFERVVVVVIGNPGKRSGLFALTDRVALIELATDSIVNVSCAVHHGLTVDVVRETGSDVVIRTGHKDKGDEWSMLAMNELMAGTKTCFNPPAPELMFLSSSLVRSLLVHDRLSDAERFVPPAVAAALRAS